MHYWQEWKTTESCISFNIMSNLRFTVNYSVLSTREFEDCSPGNLGQCFIAKAGPHLTFQFHGKKSQFYFAFGPNSNFQNTLQSKMVLVRTTREKKKEEIEGVSTLN